jgi:hypothetical protein
MQFGVSHERYEAFESKGVMPANFETITQQRSYP